MKIDKEIWAVYTFKGWASEKKVKSKKALFRKSLKKRNLKYDRIILAQFDPPYTPPYMRKNELHAPLIDYETNRWLSAIVTEMDGRGASEGLVVISLVFITV